MRRNKSFLLEALDLIEGERAESYGDAKENHARIAAMWSALLEKDVTAHGIPPAPG